MAKAICALLFPYRISFPSRAVSLVSAFTVLSASKLMISSMLSKKEDRYKPFLSRHQDIRLVRTSCVGELLRRMPCVRPTGLLQNS